MGCSFGQPFLFSFFVIIYFRLVIFCFLTKKSYICNYSIKHTNMTYFEFTKRFPDETSTTICGRVLFQTEQQEL